MTPEWGGHVRSLEKLNTLYLHLQKTRGQQTSQGVDLEWEAAILKTIWPFDHVINVGSLDSFKNLYLHYHKTFGQQTWQGADLQEEVPQAKT